MATTDYSLALHYRDLVVWRQMLAFYTAFDMPLPPPPEGEQYANSTE